LANRLADVEIARQAVEPAEEEYPPARRLFQDTLLGLYKEPALSLPGLSGAEGSKGRRGSPAGYSSP